MSDIPDGTHYATCPHYPGLVGYGDSLDEAANDLLAKADALGLNPECETKGEPDIELLAAMATLEALKGLDI